MPADPLIFLHVTKTAGGTLKEGFKALTGRRVDFVYGPADKDRLRALPPGQLDIIYGHVLHGFHADLGLAPRYACFMRHPVTRTISHYYHLRNVEKGPVGERIRASADINAFFASEDYWEFDNLMVRILSGYANQPLPPGSEALDRALDHMEAHVEFVGFQEFFPLSVRKMNATLGLNIVTAKDANVGRYALSDVSSETLDRIEALNRLDLRLYKSALRRFL
jgi:hypothetical protein